MQTLVTTIRSVGAKNVIMAGGLDWANDLSGWLAHEPVDPIHQLAAAWHSYPGEACSTTPACWTSVVAPVAAVVPLIVGETGDNVTTPATFNPTFIPWLDTIGASYFGWTWNTWQDSQYILITSYAGAPTANYGQAFQSLIAASAGVTPLGKKLSLPKHPLHPSHTRPYIKKHPLQ
jgi:hypothetical protein